MVKAGPKEARKEVSSVFTVTCIVTTVTLRCVGFRQTTLYVPGAAKT